MTAGGHNKPQSAVVSAVCAELSLAGRRDTALAALYLSKAFFGHIKHLSEFAGNFQDAWTNFQLN